MAPYDEDLEEVHTKDIYIPVMGMTGAGKSTFISLCTQELLPTASHGLSSCTSKVTAHTVKHDGRTVHLIDTPGFDDSGRSDSETLQELAYYLAAAYTHDIQISGVVYLHRITDTRWQGSASRALGAFKKMLGESNYCGVVLATTRWSELTPNQLRAAEDRHQELSEKFWADIKEQGGQILALTAGRIDAMNIVRHIVNKDRRMTLAFQKELMETKLPLGMTGPGIILFEPTNKEYEALQEQMSSVEVTLSSVIASDGASSIAELRTYRTQIAQKLSSLEENMQDMKQNIEDVRKSWDALLEREKRLIEKEFSANEQLLKHKEAAFAVSRERINSLDIPETMLVDEVGRLRKRGDDIMIAERHRLSSRKAVLSVIGTGLAVGQLVAAVACTVM
ncbi:hypothetical protein K491DRAFT_635513 [Lophiostoma macrostomum CBS 122681]|uniref:G domain-containing protein n=1 Tax=Lophiostoma macrostomum CBS 122681 TaxID=1314788 RepID=A0A6A6SXQ7_9PLEO|nr:hypothetical protein K491DRAFT_635513 [Lophiostoma macrostomum CBS 122681]